MKMYSYLYSWLSELCSLFSIRDRTQGFRKWMFPAWGVKMRVPALLHPLQRANLSHWNTRQWTKLRNPLMLTILGTLCKVICYSQICRSMNFSIKSSWAVTHVKWSKQISISGTISVSIISNQISGMFAPFDRLIQWMN
jgi:hypothetical protein